MAFIKKIGLLLIFFILLNVVSIYTFDYKSYFNTSETVSIQTDEKTESIFNNSISKIKLGQEVFVKLNTNRDKVYKGEISGRNTPTGRSFNNDMKSFITSSI